MYYLAAELLTPQNAPLVTFKKVHLTKTGIEEGQLAQCSNT